LRETISSMTAQIAESVSGMAVIQAFNREQAFLSEFDAANPPAQGETVQVRLLSINTGTRRITASLSKVSESSTENSEVQDYLSGQEDSIATTIGDAVAPAEEPASEEPLVIDPPDIE